MLPCWILTLVSVNHKRIIFWFDDINWRQWCLDPESVLKVTKKVWLVKENFIQRLLRSWKEYLEVYLMLAVQLLTTYSSDLYRYLSLRYVVKLQYRRGLYRLRTSTLLHRRRLRSCKSLHYSSGWRTISNRAIECKTQKRT